jgi:hypothetical protein
MVFQEMKLIKDKIAIKELTEEATKTFGSMVKAVVDVEKRIMVVYGEMHSDEVSLLLENNSKQEMLWGINLYPENESLDRFPRFQEMTLIFELFSEFSLQHFLLQWDCQS